MGYEETPWRNGVFRVEHALGHRDNIIVPQVGLLSRMAELIPLRLYTICGVGSVVL